MKFIFEWCKYFMSKHSKRVKYFQHKQINFIWSREHVIFFYILDNNMNKNYWSEGENIECDAINIFTSEDVEDKNVTRISDTCSFVQYLRVAYFPVKHSYFLFEPFILYS